MIISQVTAKTDYKIQIISDDGKKSLFDVKPYLELEAFSKLREEEEFSKIMNGGYFIEWDCGADLSADTIECKLLPNKQDAQHQ